MTPILMGSWAAARVGALPRTAATISTKPTRTMSRFIASPSALSPLGPDHVSHVRTTRELHHRGEVTVNEESADLHPQDAQGMRGKVVVERGPPDLAPSFLNADHVRALEGVNGAHVGAGDVGDEEPARHRRAAEIDGREVATLAIAIHHGEGELAGGRIPGRGGVQQGERAEVGHVVHTPDHVLLPIGGQIVGGTVDLDVEGCRERVLRVETQRVIDRLPEEPRRAREDRGDRIDELGEVGEPDSPAVPDEAVQVRGHGEGVGEIVALLDAAHAILVAAGAVPDVPLVEGDVDRMGDPLGQPDLLDEGRADADRPLRLVRLEDIRVVIGLARVEMNAVVVHDRGQTLENDGVPVAPAVVPAADELDGGIRPFHDQGEGAGLLDVVLGAEAADLPAAVHLVAEPPVADPIGLRMPVLTPQVRPGGIAGAVAVLDPGLGLVHGAGAHVDADVGLGADAAAILDELVGAEAVGLLGVPGELGPARASIDGPDTVEPVIAADEVAPRPAQHGYAERADRLQDIEPVAARVAQGGALLEDSAVDAAAEMLDEVSEDAPIHAADAAIQVDADPGHGAPLEARSLPPPKSSSEWPWLCFSSLSPIGGEGRVRGRRRGRMLT